MKTVIISFCLIFAIYANPITFDIVLESHDLDANSTETLTISQLSGNYTSEVQSSEESASNQSSESSESSESVESSDTTSEESDSVESNEQTELLVETRDDSMGSEENVRKSWVRVFATVVRDMSTEDNSTEATIQPEFANKMTDKNLPAQASTMKTLKQKTKMTLVQKATVNSDSSSESAESNDNTALLTTLTADSSQSVSSESNETSSSSAASDSASNSAQSSESAEDSNASDSKELNQIRDCGNGTLSCESEEVFFQDIGDDAHYSVDNLLVPDEDERELSLRR